MEVFESVQSSCCLYLSGKVHTKAYREEKCAHWCMKEKPAYMRLGILCFLDSFDLVQGLNKKFLKKRKTLEHLTDGNFKRKTIKPI